MLTESESRALVYVRVLSMLSIVVCHICQTYRLIGWSDLFNSGVQVFFVMSGFLYGNKNITSWKRWGIGRIKKLYLPYLIFLLLVIPLYFIFHEEAIKWKALPFYFMNLQGFRFAVGGEFARIEGLRHVWFLTAIMCGYLITPFLQKIKSKSKYCFPVLLLLILMAYKIIPGRFVFILSWVYLYSAGYFYANLNERHRFVYSLIFLACLFGLSLSMNWNDLMHIYSIKYRFLHDLIGISVVVWGIRLMSKVKYNVPAFVSFFDKYSFPIYITHFILICGPFSMAYLTPNRSVNILLMLVSTAVATWVLVRLIRWINKLPFIKDLDKKYLGK